MPAAPTLNSVTAYPDSMMISLDWTNNDSYDVISIYESSDGGAYNLIKTYTDGSRQAHDRYSRSHNVTYGYKIKAKKGALWSDWSNELTRTLWADTFSASVTCTPSVSHGGTEAGVYFAEVTCTPTATHQIIVNHTATATVTCTPSASHSQSIHPDYAYYIGRADGDICLTSSSYQGDAGEAITATWVSKVTDFSDQFPDWADKYKCVYSVKLIYEDLEAVSVTMFISNDGGATWTSSTKSIGTGDGKTKAKEFFFMKHGQYFQFKIVHASASTSFKWLGLEIEVEEAGDFYAVN
jgi:hypothetical protein